MNAERRGWGTNIVDGAERASMRPHSDECGKRASTKIVGDFDVRFNEAAFG